MILFVLAISMSVLAIGKNNPVVTTGEQSYSGTITTLDGQIFEFTVSDIVYEVHVPQYVDLLEINIEVDQSVDVTGYLRITIYSNIIYPTVINGFVLEDLKPLDGTGKS